MKNKIIVIFKIVLSVIQIPLSYIKLFFETAHLYDRNTFEIKTVIYSYSMFDNLKTLDCLVLFYIMIVMAIVSTCLLLLTIQLNKKKLCVTSNVVTIISVFLFVVCLVLATFVERNY